MRYYFPALLLALLGLALLPGCARTADNKLLLVPDEPNVFVPNLEPIYADTAPAGSIVVVGRFMRSTPMDRADRGTWRYFQYEILFETLTVEKGAFPDKYLKFTVEEGLPRPDSPDFKKAMPKRGLWPYKPGEVMAFGLEPTGGSYKLVAQQQRSILPPYGAPQTVAGDRFFGEEPAKVRKAVETFRTAAGWPSGIVQRMEQNATHYVVCYVVDRKLHILWISKADLAVKEGWFNGPDDSPPAPLVENSDNNLRL